MVPSIFAVSGVKHVLASGEDRRATGAEFKRWATAVIGRWRRLKAVAPPPRTDSSSRPLQTLPNHYHVQRSAGKPGRHPDRRTCERFHDRCHHHRRLTKRFGAVTAVDRLDLEVSPGEVFGFLGPNGAGKTTTIRLLLDIFARVRAGRPCWGVRWVTSRCAGGSGSCPRSYTWIGGISS